MEKKCFVALLMVVVMMCACWTGVLAEDVEREAFTSGDYEYALLDDGTVEITKYKGKAERLAIPDTLDGKRVTAIGEQAFSFCSSLTIISIPDSVAQIGENPFAACSSLKSISVSPEHPYFATIDGVLFRKADKTLISYPAGISSSTYTIPQGITSIGDSAFSYCYFLTSVSIPDSVEQIGTNPFAACFELKSISASPDHPYFATIDGVLFRKADKALISYPASISSSTYTIPRGITAIGDSAFSSCDSLTSVSIPDSVTSIGDGAFSFCTSLTSVSIPDSVTAIGDSAFSYCDSLTSVNIPDSVTSIGDSAFYSCDSLTSVSIPDSVTAIGNRAFYSCDSLTSVSIPDSVTAIGNRAFYYCDSLTSVSIPNSVTSIGDYAFGDCSNLTLTVPRNSYAAEYAKTNNIPYTYPDANDWLNN